MSAERWAAPEPARIPLGDRPAYSPAVGLHAVTSGQAGP